MAPVRSVGSYHTSLAITSYVVGSFCAMGYEVHACFEGMSAALIGHMFTFLCLVEDSSSKIEYDVNAPQYAV